jgi:2-deoxy-scyllo-inosamine dehydrogenase (SAM-dependent)/8-amino-3,8-dideoxy-alpha-D-manno-octulosonate transaminase
MPDAHNPEVTARIPLFERLQIESQSNCNRSCWFCPRTYDRSGKYLDKQGFSVLHQMPTWKILGLLDEAKSLGFRGKVGFHHYSEPLLDKRNIMLAHEARERGMKPYLHTNGDVLKRDDSLCNAVKKVYGLIVVGLYDYKTDEELEKDKRYWRRQLAGANFEFSPIGVSGARLADSIGIPKALVPTDRRMAIPDLVYLNGPCHRPLIRMIIQYDGAMANCCEDTYGAFNLGNVYQSSMEELWFSDSHAHAIHDLIAGGREKYILCRQCPLSPTSPSPDGKKIDIKLRRYVTRAEPGSQL